MDVDNHDQSQPPTIRAPPIPNISSPNPKLIQHPTELHRLISEKDFPAAVAHVQAHPDDVGSSPQHRDGRGYTALHLLIAYNRDLDGEELVPLVKGILRAAEIVDYGAEYSLGMDGAETSSAGVGDEKGKGVDSNEKRVNTNFVEDSENKGDAGQNSFTDKDTSLRKTGGSWRLLRDQENKAQWSPLHLACVQGGITHGKIPLLKALLQMDEGVGGGRKLGDSSEDDREEYGEEEVNSNESRNESDIRHQQLHLLALPDRQKRNLLHHILELTIPSKETFETAEFLLDLHPPLLFDEDERHKTPLQGVLDRMTEHNGTRRRHYMAAFGRDDANGENEGMKKNYSLLKMLIGHLDRGAGGGLSQSRMQGGAEEEESGSADTGDGQRAEISGRNVLHRACCLPKAYCPPDGSLLLFLASERASSLEFSIVTNGNGATANDNGGSKKMLTSSQDAEGNLPLHLFLSNTSYYTTNDDIGRTKKKRASKETSRQASNKALSSYQVATQIAHKLIASYPEGISVPNKLDQLPLHLAMNSGAKSTKAIIAALVVQYPRAVLLDSSLENVKILTHILGSVATFRGMINTEEKADAGNGSNGRGNATRLQSVTTLFLLLRARPDVVFLGGSTEQPPPEPEQQHASSKKKWWKQLNPFHFR